MMRIAIPILNSRISPVLDTATQLLLVDTEHGHEIGRRAEDLDEVGSVRRVRHLKELGVTALICGGISRDLSALLMATGILLIPWMAGPVEEILKAFLLGQLPDPRWNMPGCGGRRVRGKRVRAARSA